MVTYAPRTSTAAVQRAQSKVGTSYPAGWCQKWVCTEIFGTGGVGDWDGDRAADAEDGWKAAASRGSVVPASQIKSYKDIPPGVALYWTGGARDHGHAAVSAGNGMIYSTDLPTTGKIGIVPLEKVRQAWGLTFAGYVTKTGNGYTLTDRPGTPPPSSKPVATVFDICEWNIARPRWYTPWRGRAAEIQREIKDEASVYCFQELFDREQIATVKAALPRCQQFSSPAGLEMFYDVSPNRWAKMSTEHRFSGIARRGAQKVTLKRVQTGQLVDIFNVHAPIRAEGASAKAAYGKWLAKWVSESKNPVVICGDFNASSDAYSPKKELRALGYIGFKQQVAVAGESVKEFIPKKQDLCDIRTRPAGPADIASGLVDLTTNSLESDHRRLEAQVTINA